MSVDLNQQIKDFIEHRASLKRPMSDIAIKRLTNRAERFQAQGYDMEDMFDKAILNGWQSIYPPKGINPKPAAHKLGVTPALGHTADRETARANVFNIRQQLRKS